MQASLHELSELALKFRDERDWAKFHNPKDVALSLMLEAAEVAEHFQWKNETEIKDNLVNFRGALGEELCDVLYWVLILARDCELDLDQAFRAKLAKNAEKYPIEKARGRSEKYTRL